MAVVGGGAVGREKVKGAGPTRPITAGSHRTVKVLDGLC